MHVPASQASPLPAYAAQPNAVPVTRPPAGVAPGPLRQDGVARHESGVDWPTVAGLAHGFASIPGEIASDPGSLTKASSFLGTTIGDVVHAVDAHVPGLRDVPVAGAVIAAAGAAMDAPGKGLADAIVANVGSTFAATIVAGATTDALAALGAAAGPLGWAIAGVAAGAAAGYGVYRAVESRLGQDVVNGALHCGSARNART